MSVLSMSRNHDSLCFTCLPHEMLPAMALGRLAAAHVLLDVAEGSRCIRHHPLFSSAQRVFDAMTLEPNLGRSADPAWDEARSQLDALGRRLRSHTQGDAAARRVTAPVAMPEIA